MACNCAVVHVEDVNVDPEYPGTPAQSIGGVRTALSVPLVRENKTIGAFTVNRTRVQPFSESQIELVKIFADQAVIAISNVELFEEVQAKTHDLSESLQQQTATADVLKVISRSAFELQPVFDAIAENAVRLCEAERAFIFRFDGHFLRAVASYNVGPDVKRFVTENPITLGRSSISARCPRTANGACC